MVIASTSAAELLPTAVPFINVPPFTNKGAFTYPLLVLFLLSLRYSTPSLFTTICLSPTSEYPFTSTVTFVLPISTFCVISQCLYNVSVQPLFSADNAAEKALSILSKYFAVPTPEMPAVNWYLQIEHTPVLLSTSLWGHTYPQTHLPVALS